MKIEFGARVIVSEPDEENEEYQGRVGVMVREIEANSVGLKSYQVAFEGETLQPRFYAREIVAETPLPPQVVSEKQYLPATRAQIKEAVKRDVRRVMRETLERLEAENEQL